MDGNATFTFVLINLTRKFHANSLGMVSQNRITKMKAFIKLLIENIQMQSKVPVVIQRDI